MSKVITVSRTFPDYHIRFGQPTGFVEKINNYTWDNVEIPDFGGCGYLDALEHLNPGIELIDLEKLNDSCDPEIKEVKGHTVRKGKRWKTGDYASLRVWGYDVNPKSGRTGPYQSKQIIICPDIEVTVYDFEIKNDEVDCPSIYMNGKFYSQIEAGHSVQLARNDGLTLEDFKSQFKYPKPFSGQIICWNPDIKY